MCTSWNDHHDECSYHLSPYKDVTLLLTLFPTLYISSHDSFILELKVCISQSASFIWLILPTPPLWQPLNVLYIYDSISVLLCLFIFLRFHVKVKLCNIFLSLIISLSIIPSRFIHADANGKILSFYGWVLFHFICIPHYLSIHLLMDT